MFPSPLYEVVYISANSITIRNIRNGSQFNYIVDSPFSISQYSLRENGNNLLISYSLSNLKCGPQHVLYCGGYQQLLIDDIDESIFIRSFDDSKIDILVDGKFFSAAGENRKNTVSLYVKNIGLKRCKVKVTDQFQTREHILESNEILN